VRIKQWGGSIPFRSIHSTARSAISGPSSFWRPLPPPTPCAQALTRVGAPRAGGPLMGAPAGRSNSGRSSPAPCRSARQSYVLIQETGGAWRQPALPRASHGHEPALPDGHLHWMSLHPALAMPATTLMLLACSPAWPSPRTDDAAGIVWWRTELHSSKYW
jgi:hypothetical protein